MAFHLSKKNRKILDLFIPIFQENNKDFSLELNSPGLLQSIVRNSSGYSEYKWIVEKWQASVKGNRIYFKVKQLDLIIEPEPIVEDKEENINTNEHDFFSIFNILIEQPNQITFTNVRLTVDEIDRLTLWCEENNYHSHYQDYKLAIRRKD